MTELENDSLTNGDLKSKLKQENTQLVHRSGPALAETRAWRVVRVTEPPGEAGRSEVGWLTCRSF